MTNALPQNPDVIVVGAGAAGLSAAQALRSKGVEALVLEAADHIGGRCVTDTTTFSVPFDRGGSWMHSAGINPLARHAEAVGAALHKTEWQVAGAHTMGQTLSGKEFAEYRTYSEGMWDALYEATSPDADSTVEAALPEARSAGCSL